MVWDSFGRRTNEKSSLSPYEIKHSYDLFGLHNTTEINNWKIAYDRDDIGRLQGVSLNSNWRMYNDYPPATVGGPHRRLTANGAVATFGYDQLARPIGSVVEMQHPDGSVTSEMFTHDVRGVDGSPRQRMRWFKGGQIESDYYQLDGAGRVIGEIDGVMTLQNGQPVSLLSGEPDNATIAPFLAAPGGTTYALDAGAAWVTKTVIQTVGSGGIGGKASVTAYDPDALHRPRTVDGGSVGYDSADNLTHLLSRGSFYDFAYDVYGHPESLQVTPTFGKISATFKYDPLGRRVLETDSTGSHEIIWDGGQALAMTDAKGNLTLEIPGDDLDEHVASVSAHGSGHAQYYHQNWDGSVLGLSSNGGIEQGYAYSAWGERRVTFQKGNGKGRARQSQPSRFAFQGQLFDPWTGNSMMRARQYMPSIGSFTSEDPAGFIDSFNLYGFVGGATLTYGDPLGLTKQQNVDHPQLFQDSQRLDCTSGAGGIACTRTNPPRQRVSPGPDIVHAPQGTARVVQEVLKAISVISVPLTLGQSAPLVGALAGASEFAPPAAGLLRMGRMSAGEKFGVPEEPLNLPRPLGSDARITLNKVKLSSFAKRQAEALSQQAQRDVDQLLEQLGAGNANPGIGTRALGGGYFELRGANAGRVIVRQTDSGVFDIVGKFQGHVRGDAGNSNIINRLIADYKALHQP